MSGRNYRKFGIQKFGVRRGGDGGDEDMWSLGGDYNHVSDVSNLYVSSSDVLDVGNIIHVFGLNENFELQEEFLILNGQTAVVSTKKWWRVHRAHVDGDTAFVGNVYVSSTNSLTAGVPSVNDTFAIIPIGVGQTLMSLCTVPRECTAWLVSINGSMLPKNSAAAWCTLALLTRELGKVWRTRGVVGIASGGNSGFFRHYEKGIKLEEGTDVRLRIIDPSTSALDITGGFEIIAG